MVLLDLSIQFRVIIGISAMVLLFASFLIVFISNQRKKLKYHKDLQAIHEEQRRTLLQQNIILEERVNERTAELRRQKENLQSALNEIKLNQLQLIQKEKMASLGELTAGVAHEIQNPLNFVINFAEINDLLLGEMKEILSDKNLPESLNEEVSPMIADLAENVNKILHHGRRADGIVKSMLQHSRKQSGEMELTDLNSLAKEYLDLSYRSFKSKHKLFECQLEAFLDQGIEKMNVIPQDIGSILINLFNNAFYSVWEKKKLRQSDFEPAITVATKIKDGKVALIIIDNGMGIAPRYQDKIFQPFFTTKPTGEGTGLGLSLCYDIVKAHQGSISVKSIEGEYAEFTIELKY
jgi:two-component system NtrC family sensor kinase